MEHITYTSASPNSSDIVSNLLSTVIYLDERGSLAVECAVIKRPMQSRLAEHRAHGAKVISFFIRRTAQCVRAA